MPPPPTNVEALTAAAYDMAVSVAKATADLSAGSLTTAAYEEQIKTAAAHFNYVARTYGVEPWKAELDSRELTGRVLATVSRVKGGLAPQQSPPQPPQH